MTVDEARYPTRLARAGYEAYARHTGNRTFDGRPMPLWVELPGRIQEAWMAAALEIAREAER